MESPFHDYFHKRCAGADRMTLIDFPQQNGKIQKAAGPLDEDDIDNARRDTHLTNRRKVTVTERTVQAEIAISTVRAYGTSERLKGAGR